MKTEVLYGNNGKHKNKGKKSILKSGFSGILFPSLPIKSFSDGFLAFQGCMRQTGPHSSRESFLSDTQATNDCECQRQPSRIMPELMD